MNEVINNRYDNGQSMNLSRRIAKNVTVLILADVISRILGFVFVVNIARHFNDVGLGMYSFAFSFTQFFIIISNFGFIEVMIRDVSRDRSLNNKYCSNIAVIKLILSLFTFLLIFLTSNLINYPDETKTLIYIVGTYQLLISFVRVFTANFQAVEMMEYNAALNVMERFISCGLGLLIMSLGGNIIQSVFAYIIGGIFCLIIGYILYLRKFAKPKWELDLNFFKKKILSALPFALSLFFFTVYLRIDIIMLSFIKGNAVTGIYSAAHRLVEITLFIPRLYAQTVFPVMSRFYKDSKESLASVYEKSIKYLVILGAPISVGLFFLADHFILLFYGKDFSDSIVALKILAWFVIINFLKNIIGIGLSSTDRQKMRVFSQGIAAVLNVFLNIILIPKYSYVGAGIATLISEIVLLSSYLYYMSKYNCKVPRLYDLGKPIISCVIMVLLLNYLKPLNIYINILLSGIGYVGCLFLLKTFNTQDYQIFRKIVRNA